MKRKVWTIDFLDLFLNYMGISLSILEGRVLGTWWYVFSFDMYWSLSFDLKILAIEVPPELDSGYYSYHGLLAIENNRLKSILFFNLPHKD